MEPFWQLLGVYLILLLDELGMPLPFVSPSVMVALSVQWRQGYLPLWAIVLTAAAASATGTLLLYGAGRFGARQLVLRYGHWVGISEERLLELEEGLRENAFWALLSARFVPGLTAPSSVLAGTLRVAVPVVLAAGQITSLTWAFFWLIVGNLGFGLLAPLFGWLPLQLQTPAAVLTLSLLLVTLVWVVRRLLRLLWEGGRGLFPPV